VAEKKLKLIEAFRTVLRARYPSRPALADEVENADYFRPPFDGDRGVEVQAVADALDVLRDAIVKQSVRLHGRLDGERPADIDPSEITRTGILVFDNALDVWQPTTRVSQFRQLPIYLNVHCYAADIEALIGGCSDSVLTSFEAAERGVKACYPDSVPHDVVNAVLCRNVGAWVKTNLPNMAAISDSTIKRAAGRKK
jgi:hypothetical protein